ncbi:ATP-binding protein [Neorhizobium galegae]|nr:ATP-binding protein [Neorhizobium galegae]MCQ1768057.1 ATP-binding protein [Neorhizobium galegae]MCQ1848565.1 ATP-binding protein [Neorhizobium galegae]
MDASDLAIADKMTALRNRYIPFERDEIIHRLMKNAVGSLSSSSENKSNKKRIIAIGGESGSGKTACADFHISRQKALQPYRDEDGVLINPVLVFDAPSPCTPRLLAIEALLAMRITVADRISANMAWQKFRKMLRKHKIKFVLIDEMQNAIEYASENEIGLIADALKQIVQQRDWPIHMMLAGVPPLGALLSHKQLINRNNVVYFDPIDPLNASTQVQAVIDKVIIVQAGLTKDDALSKEDFPLRLAHARMNDLGSIIGTVRDAVEVALYAGRTTVLAKDFEEVYALSGCKGEENIFAASNWRIIDPLAATMREGDYDWVEDHIKPTGSIPRRGQAKKEASK